MKLELYYYDQCPFCQLVLRKIESEELNSFIDFKNTLTDESNRQFHQQQTGRTTVPCLYIDGKPLFESQDICQWLEQNANQLKN